MIFDNGIKYRSNIAPIFFCILSKINTSMASIFNNLGVEFDYFREPRSAVYNFNQKARSLYINQPRLPFQYYIDIRLNNVGTAASYISKFFNNPQWAQIAPLVKSIDMPSFRIETTPLNQYNRKRLSQTKIAYEPVKVVFHDVADGKTLKFWDMYYRYYFEDGNEAGQNIAKQSQQQNGTTSIEQFLQGVTPSFTSNILGLPASVNNLFQSNAPNNSNSPTNTVGNKSALNNIVSNTLDNQHFGFNLPQVGNIRNLIQEIDIYQVHGGRFNQVTLVNPRVSAFNHDILNYAEGGKSLELTFVFEYEYAYYTIQNLQLGGNEVNNSSSKEQFSHAEIVELPGLAFNAALVDFLTSNNPLLTSDNPIIQQIGKNVQSSIADVANAFVSNPLAQRVSSSVLGGLINVSPSPLAVIEQPIEQVRNFASTAIADTSAYVDVNRIVGGLFG